MTAPEPPAKVAPRLAERLGTTPPPEPVEVVIELAGGPPPASGSRAERMAAARSSFARDLDAVRKTITAAGGEVLDAVWLNRTVRGRVPAGGIPAVAAAEGVAVVDLPRRIEPDAQPATNSPSP
jgi:hypothetical protein